MWYALLWRCGEDQPSTAVPLYRAQTEQEAEDEALKYLDMWEYERVGVIWRDEAHGN